MSEESIGTLNDLGNDGTYLAKALRYRRSIVQAYLADTLALHTHVRIGSGDAHADTKELCAQFQRPAEYIERHDYKVLAIGLTCDLDLIRRNVGQDEQWNATVLVGIHEGIENLDFSSAPVRLKPLQECPFSHSDTRRSGGELADEVGVIGTDRKLHGRFLLRVQWSAGLGYQLPRQMIEGSPEVGQSISHEKRPMREHFGDTSDGPEEVLRLRIELFPHGKPIASFCTLEPRSNLFIELIDVLVAPTELGFRASERVPHE